MYRLKRIVLMACLIIFFATGLGSAGSKCGSSSSIVGKVFKYTSADWWPSAMLLDVVFIAYTGTIGFTKMAALACSGMQGQAYLGDACKIHDDCYDGLAYPGSTRTQCDHVLKEEWIKACEKQYNPAEWWDVTQEACRSYCVKTVEMMAFIQTNSSAAQNAWDKAALQRINNITISALPETNDPFTIQKDCVETSHSEASVPFRLEPIQSSCRSTHRCV